MKKIIAVAGAFALAACGGNDVDEPMEAELDDAAEVTTLDTTGDSPVGTYSMQDGAVMTEIAMNADGTYTVSEDGTQIQGGTWTNEDGALCLTAPEAESACFTRTPGDDGTVSMEDITGETTVWEYQP